MAASASAPAPRVAVPRAAPAGPVAAPALLRLCAFAPLALYGALHWAGLVSPSAGGDALLMVVASTASGAALMAVPRLRGRLRRALAVGALALALAVLAFLASGVPLHLLGLRAWGDLAAGVGQGISSMPGVSVPYGGADVWVRTAILLGGMLLIGLAALLAWWPRRAGRGGVAPSGHPMAAAVTLGVLYGVPVVERGPHRPFLDGAVFCLLLGAFLGLERLRADQLGVGAGCLLLATTAGLLVAPRLDGQRPWFDYERFAESLQPQVSESFAWDHSYGPLKWPRDGREMLRVKASSASYWKAVNLDDFDGVRWRASGAIPPLQPDSEIARGNSDWHQTITVVLRGLTSREFIGAGTTEAILGPSPRVPVQVAPGTFVTGGKALVHGQSYRARVYTPRPTELQLRNDGTDYPDFTDDYLTMDLPPSVGGRSALVPYARVPPGSRMSIRFAPFGSVADPLVEYPDGYVGRDKGARLMRASAYGRVYALARQLRTQAAGPYDFAVKVRDRVELGASYTETPAVHRLPLVSFLFDDRRGYCQQFSGAMALLLRMGGVPARVATGFTPGTLDRKRDEFVVRDVDAHSWVEAYFPHIGWVPFDPTPSIAPARSQTASSDIASPVAAGPPRAGLGRGDRPGDPGSPASRQAATGGGLDWRLPAGGVLLLALTALGLVSLSRRGRLPEPPLAAELAELQRALHRSGRTPSPDMTLRRLERVLGGSDAAAAYVRALCDTRYGAGPVAAPTGAQRRALRQELAAGLGLRGRLRALWALPPHVPWRRPYTGG